MPISSYEIAQALGGYQSMAMQQMAYSGMIGPGIYQPTPTQGQQSIGDIINTAVGVGAPIASFGASMLGLDPSSLALRAGGFAAKHIGLGAGLGVGAAAFAAATPFVVGLGYMGSQMMGGMQQQQGLNHTLRSNYGHIAPFGGQGWTTGAMHDFGSQLRHETTVAGPMGQHASFGELQQLAANMGRMGMTQGVSSAREFAQNFRNMLQTVRQVAEQIGTSLEEAQRTMVALKNSGVFGMGKQQGFLNAMHQTAMGAGISMTEVASAVHMGSQISRQIGGRGRAGALGGMVTSGAIGAAMNAHALSEEDIYNATGLAGQEGRQAFAQQTMMTSARFLQSSFGRRIAAAMAGKNGTLNESAVQEFMSGGVGTGRTMQLAGQNLASTGRFDYLYNEGRIKGEILGRFGGLMPAMAVKGWFEDRGLDMNDTRSKLMAQRMFGFDRDEMENTLKMVRALPVIQRNMEESKINMESMKELKEQQAHTGIEGFKHKLEAGKIKVQSKLEELGANILRSGTRMLDRFFDSFADRYVDLMYDDAHRYFKAAVSGDEKVWKEYFGGSGGMDIMKVAPSGMARRQKMSGSVQAGQIDRLTAAGYGGTLDNSFGAQMSRHIVGARIGDAAQIGLQGGLAARHQRGVSLGMAGLDEGLQAAVRQFTQDSGKLVAQAEAFGGFGGMGAERIASFGEFLSRAAQGPSASAKSLWEKWQTASDEQKAAIMSASAKGGGSGIDQSRFFRGVGGTQLSGITSVENRQELLGGSYLDAMGGLADRYQETKRQAETRAYDESTWRTIGRGVGVAAALLNPVTMLPTGIGMIGAGMGFDLGGQLGEMVSRGALTPEGADKARKEKFGGMVGQFAESKQYRDMARRLYSDDTDTSKKAMGEVVAQMSRLQAAAAEGGTFGDMQGAGAAVLTNAYVGASLHAKMRAYGLGAGDDPSALPDSAKQELLQQWRTTLGSEVTLEQAQQMRAADAVTINEQSDALVRQVGGIEGRAARERTRDWNARGLGRAKGDRRSGVFGKGLTGRMRAFKAGPGAERFLDAIEASEEALSLMTDEQGGADNNRKQMGRAQFGTAVAWSELGSMTSEQRESLMQRLASQGGYGTPQMEMLSRAQGGHKAVSEGYRRRGKLGGIQAATSMLGIGVSTGDMLAYARENKKSMGELSGMDFVQMQEAQAGISFEDSTRKELAAAYDKAGKGGGGVELAKLASTKEDVRKVQEAAAEREDPKTAQQMRALTGIKEAVGESKAAIVTAIGQLGERIGELKS